MSDIYKQCCRFGGINVQRVLRRIKIAPWGIVQKNKKPVPRQLCITRPGGCRQCRQTMEVLSGGKTANSPPTV